MYAASLAPSGCTARFAVYLLLQAGISAETLSVRFGADSVEKVESRSFSEVRLDGSEIFGLIWLPLQIDYGHLGLTRSRIMRPSASLSRNEAYGAEKIASCRQTDFFNEIGPTANVKRPAL